MYVVVFDEGFRPTSNIGIRFLISFCLFLILDATWLLCMSKYIYKQFLDERLEKIPFKVGVFMECLYVLISALFISILLYFESYSSAILFGCCIGFLIYATFNITTLVITPSWGQTLPYTWKVPIIDTLWGMFLWSVVCVFIFLYDEKY